MWVVKLRDKALFILSSESKMNVLKAAGVEVVNALTDIGVAMQRCL
jgi:hypothetical protein